MRNQKQGDEKPRRELVRAPYHVFRTSRNFCDQAQDVLDSDTLINGLQAAAIIWKNTGIVTAYVTPDGNCIAHENDIPEFYPLENLYRPNSPWMREYRSVMESLIDVMTPHFANVARQAMHGVERRYGEPEWTQEEDVDENVEAAKRAFRRFRGNAMPESPLQNGRLDSDLGRLGE
jgi:hypothetical protein